MAEPDAPSLLENLPTDILLMVLDNVNTPLWPAASGYWRDSRGYHTNIHNLDSPLP